MNSLLGHAVALCALALCSTPVACATRRPAASPPLRPSLGFAAERLTVQWWQEWERDHGAFCPGRAQGERLGLVQGIGSSMCWGASFRGRVELGLGVLETTPGTTSSLVTCTRADGSTSFANSWSSSQETDPGLFSLSGDGSGRLLALLDDRVPARVRLFDAAGRVEREVRVGAGYEAWGTVSFARLVTGSDVLLGLQQGLVVTSGKARWATPLADAVGGAWVATTATGAATVAAYYQRDRERQRAVLTSFSHRGGLQWRALLGALTITDLAPEADHGAVLVGTFRGALSVGARELRSRYGSAAFVARMGAGGEIIWVEVLDAPEGARPLSVAVDRAGMISVLVAHRDQLELKATVLRTPGDTLTLLRFGPHGDSTLGWSIEATPTASGSIGVDALGGVWLELQGLSLHATLGGTRRSYDYDPRGASVNPAYPSRCVLAKAAAVPLNSATAARSE